MKNASTTRTRFLQGFAPAIFMLGLFALVGCQGNSGDGETANAKIQEEIFTDQLPSDVLSLAEANAQVGEEMQQLRVVGRIFAEETSPFDSESASFIVIEVPKPGHDTAEHADCPFCKRDRANAANAMIQIVDDAGEILKTPADELLGLEVHQDIVVDGEAQKVGEFLIVNAKSIHIPSAEAALAFSQRIHGKSKTEDEDIATIETNEESEQESTESEPEDEPQDDLPAEGPEGDSDAGVDTASDDVEEGSKAE